MRCDQYMGLTEEAWQFLSDNCKNIFITTIREYPKKENGDIHMVKSWGKELWKETYDEFEGMFGQKYPLHKYHLSDGSVMLEKVQTDPWSSGPMFFLMLVDEKTGETFFEWTEDQINDNL